MSDFKRRNRKAWISALERLFPSGIPESGKWTSTSDIIHMLSGITQRDLNHMFFPSGGGLDLTAAKASSEPGCIDLMTGKVAYIVRPAALTFHSFPACLSESYFRLETAPLQPSGVYEDLSGDHEEVVEIAPQEYHHRSIWDEQNLGEGEDGMIPLPPGSRLVLRHFRGVFLFVAKGSMYNSITATYDARHSTKSDLQFWNYMQHLFTLNKEWIDKIEEPVAT